MRRVLILGGTHEARRLAAELTARDVRVVSTLAGRVRDPALPAGEVRIGGFGGPGGLTDWLCHNGIGVIVDATHPFAERISASAAEASRRTGIPIVTLRRPGWTAGSGDDWRWVGSLDEAARLLPTVGTRAFLTTGRQGLAAFAALDAVWFLIRCVDRPEPPLPPSAHVLLARGPFTVPGESELMREHRIDVLVTKDSGGDLTVAKLTAARELGLPVIVVRRPPAPGVPTVATVEAALSWLDSAAG